MSLSAAKKRVIAERLFINEGMTAKAIANELDVTEATVSKWKKGRTGEKDWNTRRTEVLSAPHRIKELLLKELENVANGDAPKIKTDALAKISKVMENLSGKSSVQVVITVFKEFDNWMAEQEPELAIKFTEFHKQFLHYKASLE